MSKAEKIARAFSARVLKYIGPKKLALAVKRNATPEYEDCCATHDFCDANVFMDRAFRAVTGKSIRLQNDADRALWNKAWSLAQSRKFFL